MPYPSKLWIVAIAVVCLSTSAHATIARTSIASRHAPQIWEIQRHLMSEGDADVPITPDGRFWMSALPGTNLTLVYAEDKYLCGSGGCGLEILRPVGKSFHDISDISLVFTPITLLPTKHHRLPDLGVVCREDDAHRWQGVARFNGRIYTQRCDVHIGADVSRPKGRLLLTDAGEGLPIDPHVSAQQQNAACLKKVAGKGYPIDLPFGIRMPFCREPSATSHKSTNNKE